MAKKKSRKDKKTKKAGKPRNASGVKRPRHPDAFVHSFASFKDPNPPEGKDEDYKVSCYSKNNLYPAEKMFLNSHELCLFDCKVCNHTFSSALNNVVRGRWCGYCSGHKICGKEECKECTPKTMISISGIKEIWSEKNTLKPYEVLKGADSFKIWIKCHDQNCNHHYKIKPNTYNSLGKRCSYCYANSITFCEQTKENIICELCFKKCFGSHPMSIHWNYELNGDKTPYNIAKNSNKKYKFNCPDCKEIYEANPANIVSNGIWCNCKQNKTETLVYKFLVKIFGCDNVQREFSDKSWTKYTKSKGYFRFDFVINSKRIFIEVDGGQHFREIWKKTPEEQCKQDCFKMDLAIKHGYSIIRICQEDIWKKIIKWKRQLRKTIDKVDESEYLKICYLSKDKSLYDDHRKNMKILLNNINIYHSSVSESLSA